MSKKAIIFPGQGAQTVGMGKDWADVCGDIRGQFDRAGEILGFDLAKVCFEGPQEELTASDRAQPAIFLVSVASFKALESKGYSFDVAAGLSSGEWAALHYAGVLGFDDCIKALEARGRLMQQACEAEAGGMLTLIGLDPAKCGEVAEACGVQVANLNSPAQTVLSGPVAGIEKAQGVAKEAGAKIAKILPVAGAFHSRMMAPAAEAFAEVVDGLDFQTPRIPVLSNVTGEAHEDVASIKSRVVEQITGSVQWVQNTETMKAMGVDTYVESGPGKVLTGLIKRMHPGCTLHNVQGPADFEALPEA